MNSAYNVNLYIKDTCS